MSWRDFIFWGILLIIIISIIYYSYYTPTVKINVIDIPAKCVLKDEWVDDESIDDEIYVTDPKKPNGYSPDEWYASPFEILTRPHNVNPNYGQKVYRPRDFHKNMPYEEIWVEYDGEIFPLLN